MDEARHVRQTEGPGVRRERASAERGAGEAPGAENHPCKGSPRGLEAPRQALDGGRSFWVYARGEQR